MIEKARVVEPTLLDYFCFHYQPQYCLDSGELRGYESLIRLMHPTLGVLTPASFLDKIDNVGSWLRLWPVMLDCIESDSLMLNSAHKLAINVSPIQLEHDFFINYLEEVIDKNKLSPENIEIEITENVVISDYKRVSSAISRLNELDISVVIDDFGSGYSNLKHLEKLAVQGIKLDREFVTGIESSPVKQIIVESVVNIASVKGCFVLAEGIEKPIEKEVVQRLGCKYGQGYLFGRPDRKFINKGLNRLRAESCSLYEHPLPGRQLSMVQPG